MLKPRPRPAQDSMKYALPCPQWQSREAGSCLGAIRPAGGRREAFVADCDGRRRSLGSGLLNRASLHARRGATFRHAGWVRGRTFV